MSARFYFPPKLSPPLEKPRFHYQPLHSAYFPAIWAHIVQHLVYEYNYQDSTPNVSPEPCVEAVVHVPRSISSKVQNRVTNEAQTMKENRLSDHEPPPFS